MLYPVELRAPRPPLLVGPEAPVCAVPEARVAPPTSADWSGQRDLNPRPSAPKADALPDCAMPRPCLPGGETEERRKHVRRLRRDGQTAGAAARHWSTAPPGGSGGPAAALSNSDSYQGEYPQY